MTPPNEPRPDQPRPEQMGSDQGPGSPSGPKSRQPNQSWPQNRPGYGPLPGAPTGQSNQPAGDGRIYNPTQQIPKAEAAKYFAGRDSGASDDTSVDGHNSFDNASYDTSGATRPHSSTGQYPVAPKHKRNTGKLIGLIAGGLVVVLVLVLIASEFLIRNHITNCLDNGLAKDTHSSSAEVSLGSTPMLMQWAKGSSSPKVTLHDFEGRQGLTVVATLTDLGSDGKAKDAHIDADYSMADLQRYVQSRVPLIGSALNISKASDDTLKIGGPLATVNISLVPAGSELKFQAQSAQILGFGLPTELVQQVVNALQERFVMPDGLTFTKATVTDDGIHVTLDGQNVTLSGTGPSAASKCV